MCDFLRDAYTDTIKPYADAPLEVERRWYRVGDDAPTLAHPSTFLSEFSEAFPYLDRAAGFVWPTARDTTRRNAPAGLSYTPCGTAADFAGLGTFDPARNVVYDADWVPTCCGGDTMCVFNLCSTDDEYGWRAAQLRTYPVPHQTATDTTPLMVEHWGLNLGDNAAGWPGVVWEWKPGGALGDAVRQFQLIADENGALQFQVDAWDFGAGNTIAQTINAQGIGQDFALGGDVGGYSIEFVGGVLTLTGTNFRVAKAALPPDTSYLTGDFIPGGTAGAPAPVGPGVHVVNGGTGPTRFFQLLAVDGFVADLIPNSLHGAVIFPPTGERFVGLATDAPVAIINTTVDPTYAWRVARTVTVAPPENVWTLQKYNARGGLSETVGTVTSVGISTSSTGLSVGGGPITAAGSLTVDLAADLEQLVGFPTAAAIPVGDGAGNWDALGFGEFLSLSGGDLILTPPGATEGELEVATFAITGTSGTYQATGSTFTLTTPGTYRITGKLRGDIQPSAAGVHFITAKLRNTTAGADVAKSETWIVSSATNGEYVGATAGFAAKVTIAGSTTFEVYAFRAGTSWTTSQLTSDTNGRSVIEWERLY